MLFAAHHLISPVHNRHVPRCPTWTPLLWWVTKHSIRIFLFPLKWPHNPGNVSLITIILQFYNFVSFCFILLHLPRMLHWNSDHSSIVEKNCRLGQFLAGSDGVEGVEFDWKSVKFISPSILQNILANWHKLELCVTCWKVAKHLHWHVSFVWFEMQN